MIRQSSKLQVDLDVLLSLKGQAFYSRVLRLESGRDMSKEVEGFQVEVEKFKRVERVYLYVGTVRGLRGRRKLVGEAFMTSPYQAIINYQVKHAKDIDDLLSRFIRQLIVRGYRPLLTRCLVNGHYEEWLEVDASRFDMSSLDLSRKNVESHETS